MDTRHFRTSTLIAGIKNFRNNEFCELSKKRNTVNKYSMHKCNYLTLGINLRTANDSLYIAEYD